MTTAAPPTTPMLYPLDEFCRRAGRPLPQAAVLEPSEVPEPYRTLLVHGGDMTTRLLRFHQRPLWVRVLMRAQEGEVFYREVVLVRDDDQTPVEYGAIRINLSLLDAQPRWHVLQCHLPLGSILRLYRLRHESRPRAFVRLTADERIRTALRLDAPCDLYGRCNVLLDGAGRALAEVVEILPPAGATAPKARRQGP